MKHTKHLLSLLVLSAMAAAPSARATPIPTSYTVDYSDGGAGPTAFGGDTLTLSPVSGSVTLVPNSSTGVSAELNPLTWNYTTTGSAGTYTGALSQSLMITTPDLAGSQSLNQEASVSLTGGGAQVFSIGSSVAVSFSWTSDSIYYTLYVVSETFGEPLTQPGPGILDEILSGDFFLTATTSPAPSWRPDPPHSATETSTPLIYAALLLPLWAGRLRMFRNKPAA
jgi:hypothetical protein